MGNNKTNKINYHIIFSNKVSIQDIEEEFIKKLEIEGLDNRSLTYENLKLYGEKIQSSIPEKKRNNNSPIEEGFNSFVVGIHKVMELLNKKLFRDKFLLAIGKNEWEDFRWDGSPDLKKSLINDAHFVFVASQDIESVLNSKQKLKEQNVNNLILHCSDAHQFSEGKSLPKKLGHCFTWIKADPAFEGLKQIIYEPEERVFIGEEPTLLKRVRGNSTKFIDRIKITWNENYDGGKGIWFKDIEIPLNYGMVSIIGNKGNGKSALADIISLCANSHRNREDFSFLNKNRFLKGKLADNFKATLVWKNGEEIVKLLSDETDKTQVERVKYIPQGFFERLTNDIDKKEFEEEIENIVFSYLSKEDKLGKSSFKELIATKKSKIDKDIEILLKQLSNINKQIAYLENMNTKEYLFDLKSKYELKRKELKELKKIKPVEVRNPQEDEELSDEMKIKYEKLQKLKKDKEEINKKIEEYSKKINKLALEIEELKEVRSEFRALKSNIDFTLQKVENFLKKFNIKQNKIFSYNLNLKLLEQIIENKTKEKEELKKLITSDYSYLNEEEKNKNFQYIKFKVEEDIKKISKQISEPMKKYQEYLKSLEEWNNKRRELIGNKNIPFTILWLRNQIQYIKFNLKDEIEKLEQKRLKLVKDIFKKKLEIFNLYEQLKNVIDSKIISYDHLMKDYKINIDVSFKLNDEFVRNFLSFINKKARGYFKGKEESYENLKILIEQIENFNNWENISTFLSLIIKNIKKEDITKQINDLEKFYNFLFSLEYMEAYYELKLGNKSLSSLSPGERGALLIVFYLMLDKDDIPLIIDQPEENLDNESIYKILVHFIKEVKKRRQLIIVTHNPNLAIVGDSEQIIYVNLDKENDNKFTFESGSIENLNINKHCSRILEGTIKAFDYRRIKYFKYS